MSRILTPSLPRPGIVSKTLCEASLGKTTLDKTTPSWSTLFAWGFTGKNKVSYRNRTSELDSQGWRCGRPPSRPTCGVAAPQPGPQLSLELTPWCYFGWRIPLLLGRTEDSLTRYMEAQLHAGHTVGQGQQKPSCCVSSGACGTHPFQFLPEQGRGGGELRGRQHPPPPHPGAKGPWYRLP